MLLAIEGPRAAGKSSLIRSVAAEIEVIETLCEVVVIDYDPRPWPTTFERLSRFVTMAAESPKLYLHDRFHLSEYVYSRLSGRRPMESTRQEVLRIDQQICAMGGKTIILDSEEDVLEARRIAAGKPVDYSPRLVRQLFKDIAKSCESTQIVYNDSQMDKMMLMHDIEAWVRRELERHAIT